MARKLFLIIAILAVGAFVGWRMGLRAPEPVHAQVDAPKTATPTLPVDTVLQVRPAASNSAPSASSASSRRHNESPALAQFHEGKDFASLYGGLEGNPSPETLYLRAEIYARCAKHRDDAREKLAARRAEMAAALAQTGTNAAQRLSAFDRLNANPCAGLDLGPFDRQELARMVGAAAAAGDARAQAWQLAERADRAFRDTADQVGQTHATGYPLGDADFEQARRLLASGDPDVILDLRGMLSSSIQQGTIRLGDQPVDNRALYDALGLLACDAGAHCGPDSQELLMNCAYRGRCAAGTLYEYMFYYDTSPADAQLIDGYRRALAAMLNAGDFSGLTLSRAGGIPGFSMFFGGRRLYDEGGTPPAQDPPAPKALRAATAAGAPRS